MKNDKCGIYQIVCEPTGKIYVGSSMRIYQRWYGHRRQLSEGNHHSPHLQHAWNKYDEAAFSFVILEECKINQLELREQFYIDQNMPVFNSMLDVARRLGPEVLEKRAISLRARAALITHCPKGHEYDEQNTYISKKNKRICRKCNAEHVSRIYANETSEQRELRRVRANEAYDKMKSTEEYQNYIKQYTIDHKEKRADYDRQRRPLANKQRQMRLVNETPEQRERRLAQKRASYHSRKGL